MMQKIVCHEGKCTEVRKMHIFQRDSIAGLIEKDLLESELGDLHDE